MSRSVAWSKTLTFFADDWHESNDYTKVAPITRIDGGDLQPGPFYRRAQQLCWQFAHATAID